MLKGLWYSAGSNRQYNATFHIIEKNFVLDIENLDSLHGELNKLIISEKIGTTKRTITFSDQSLFIVSHHPILDTIQANKYTLLDKIESNSKYIIGAIFALVLCVFLFYNYLFPPLSNIIANSVPTNIKNIISKQSLEFFEEDIVSTSKIKKEKKDEIENDFKKLVEKLDIKNQTFRLHIRELNFWNTPIANAFALPSGDIIITDELINKSKNNLEINTILLHEIAHVTNNHGMKMVIRNSLLSAILLSVFGDTNALADFTITLGTFVINNSYSQEFEEEADLYAFKSMLKLDIDPIHFHNIFERITKSTKTNTKFNQYFSSHPSNISRLKLANKYHQCFEKKDFNYN